nr:MAG TPA: hypothetical protein [Caudoviricetes sp.]
MYIEKLTKKNIEELERVVMGCDCFDRQQTQIYIDSNPNLYVTFWEEIPPDDDEPEKEKHYAESRYVYSDFDPPYIYDWSSFDQSEIDQSEINAKYFGWMLNKFGEKYIKDYFEYHTGVSV